MPPAISSLPTAFRRTCARARRQARRRRQSRAASLEVGRLTRELLAGSGGNIYYHVQAAVDRVVLDAVLEHVKGNQVEAAELLGISRNTLRSKLRNLGLVVEKQLNEAE